MQLLADISSSCFYDTFYKQNTEEDMKLCLEKSFSADTLKQELRHKNNYFFFLKSAEEIFGYIKLSDAETPDTFKESDALEIARIYVVKEKIGSGIGKSLMDFAISFAEKRNKAIIWLAVWEHNNRAINFYHSYNFKKFGERIFWLGSDAQNDWLMKKDLTVL